MSGVTFMDKHGMEYMFDEEEDTVLPREQELQYAPFPDIPAEAPGMLAQHESIISGEDVIEDETTTNDQERAMLAAENSGITFEPVVNRPLNNPEIIEILDDDDDDNIGGHIYQDIVKTEDETGSRIIDAETNPNQMDADMEGMNRPRRSERTRIANRLYNDYELYTTMNEEEERFTHQNDSVADGSMHIGEDALEAVAHYIMMHYAEKERIVKRKKKYKPKEGQYGLNVGLRKFGEKGEAAVTKELDQFNNYDVFEPLFARDLSQKEKDEALSSLIFLKEKRNGDIKARSCANGSVQREHVAKDEVASPTVSLESVFVTSTIDAREGREVVVIDIPGAFLHAHNDDYVIMKMNGTLAELMAKTDPKLYRKYLSDERGKKVLYLRLRKALYGMMKSALLFYRKLVSELISMGFEINPYDPCVANKVVNGNQMTLRWHVDDLMISHKNGDDIKIFLRGLKDIYGNNLAENVGKLHDYLGMEFDFSSEGEVKINMTKYIKKIIKDFPEEILGKQATPAGDHLFKVREDGRKLDEEQANAFHHTVYQLLFAANRTRRDIQTAVSFLTTRVKEPDEDDWGKLKRVLKYLNGTKYLKLTLEANKINFTVHWYVDGSHQIHEDCRGQSGALMTLGKGAVHSSSTKMKCNTKSSTETELISLADKLSDIMWLRYFIECQGYDLDEYIVYQDNMSALSLEKNGRISSSKRTKHIKAKYFLIKDYYDSGEIDVKFCPTDEMWADVLTKPLQGQKFRDMRAFLQNCPKDYDDDREATYSMKQLDATSLRECVGEHAKQELYRPASPTCVSSQITGDKTEISLGERMRQKI
jgi:hypothetical protein